MEKRIHIGLVGDYSEKIYTHVALNQSVEHSRSQLQFQIETSWIPTETIDDAFLVQQKYNGFWVAPGSPYKNDEGVYKLIRWCRENNFPLLGTCGGFQYMVVEYARNVLRITDAGHEESEPGAAQLVVSRLSCSLKGEQEEVVIQDKQSRLYHALQQDRLFGSFNCSYGVNPAFTNLLNQYPFVFTAFSSSGEPRAFELKAHRFYCGTLFQPPLDSTNEKPNPVLIDFFKACAHS